MPNKKIIIAAGWAIVLVIVASFFVLYTRNTRSQKNPTSMLTSAIAPVSAPAPAPALATSSVEQAHKTVVNGTIVMSSSTHPAPIIPMSLDKALTNAYVAPDGTWSAVFPVTPSETDQSKASPDGSTLSIHIFQSRTAPALWQIAYATYPSTQQITADPDTLLRQKMIATQAGMQAELVTSKAQTINGDHVLDFLLHSAATGGYYQARSIAHGQTIYALAVSYGDDIGTSTPPTSSELYVSAQHFFDSFKIVK